MESAESALISGTSWKKIVAAFLLAIVIAEAAALLSVFIWTCVAPDFPLWTLHRMVYALFWSFFGAVLQFALTGSLSCAGVALNVDEKYVRWLVWLGVGGFFLFFISDIFLHHWTGGTPAIHIGAQGEEVLRIGGTVVSESLFRARAYTMIRGECAIDLIILIWCSLPLLLPLKWRGIGRER
ncbi:MAG TPA: hypothetical protein VGP72_17550 [Planctomycetota bacterium]|jgi:hypothetical protein